MANNITAIQRRMEYGRFYAEAELTEDAVYVKGEVPEDYAGSFIAVIHVCYGVVSTDITGRILFTTYNPPDLKDKEGNDGLEIKDNEGNTVRERTGSGTVSIDLVWEANTHFPANLKTHADNMWEVAKREMGTWFL